MVPETIFTTIYFLCNLQMGPISQSVAFHWAERITVTNTIAYWEHLLVTKKMKLCEYSPRDNIHNTSFSS
jgi:hypothetical protein